MPVTQSFVGGHIERPLIGNNEDEIPRLATINRSDGRALEAASTEPNDGAWAVAFKLNVAITVMSALYFRQMALAALTKVLDSSMWCFWIRSESHSVEKALPSLVMAVPTACAMSLVLLQTMATCPALVLQLIFAGFVLVSVAAVSVAANAGLVLLSAVLAAVCAVIAGVFCVRRGRINFAAANLKAAALSVRSTPHVVVWALCAMAVRGMLLAVFAMASFGSVHAFQQVIAPEGETYFAADCHTVALSMSTTLSCECNGDAISNTGTIGCRYGSYNMVLVCAWIASLSWTYNVTTKIVAATVADSVTTWWTSPDDVKSMWVPFHRVMHSSQGSVCKAAGIAGFFQLMNVGVYLVLDTVWEATCILACARFAVNYMLDNTVYFVSMHRLGFSIAVRRAWTLFRKHGLTLSFNEVVVAMGLYLSSLPALAMAVVVITVAALPPMISLPSSTYTLCVFFGSVIVVMLPMLEVVQCACKAVFICFLQDPGVFASSHDRRLYDGLFKAWREMGLEHPTATEDQGGMAV